MIENTCFNVVIIYRPPQTHSTKGDFLKEFGDLMASVLSELKNVIIGGDFNFWMNSTNSSDNILLCNLSLGLRNLVNVCTHIGGNTPDLLIVEDDNPLNLQNCEKGVLISDHYMVVSNFYLPNKNREKKQVSFRRLDGISSDDFSKHLNEHMPVDFDGSDVSTLDKYLKTTLDKLAPVVTKSVMVRYRVPWFTTELKDKKRAIRQIERSWRKNKNPEKLDVLKSEIKIYKKLLFTSKKELLSNEIKRYKGNSKKLFNYINNLLGMKNPNPLPSSVQQGLELEEQFADFFMQKKRQSAIHYLTRRFICQFTEMCQSLIVSILCQRLVLPRSLIQCPPNPVSLIVYQQKC